MTPRKPSSSLSFSAPEARISVLVPLRNEAAFVAGCLPTILAQDDPRIVEILLVDGASTDGTRNMIRGTLEGCGWDAVATADAWRRDSRLVRLLTNPSRYVPQGLNIGLVESSGNVIVRMDAHSSFHPDYVRRCVDGLIATGASNYGGVAETVPSGQGAAAAAVAAVTSHPLGVGGSRFRTGVGGPGPADTVPFGCFPRSLFDVVGVFDERLARNQDNEFNARIRKHGGIVFLDPSIRFRYYNQKTVHGLVNQGWRTGYWNSKTLRLCPYAFRWRYVLPAALVLSEAGAAVALAFGLAAGNRGAILAGLAPFLLYALVWLAATPAIRRRWGCPAAALAPVVAFAYQNAYGSGVIAGLFRQAARRAPGSAAGDENGSAFREGNRTNASR